jgi:hypothetical protein
MNLRGLPPALRLSAALSVYASILRNFAVNLRNFAPLRRDFTSFRTDHHSFYRRSIITRHAYPHTHEPLKRHTLHTFGFMPLTNTSNFFSHQRIFIRIIPLHLPPIIYQFYLMRKITVYNIALLRLINGLPLISCGILLERERERERERDAQAYIKQMYAHTHVIKVN